MSVWKKEAFRNNDHIDQYIKGFYYGMLAVVGIYNFLMFFIVREKSHLYYVFYLASFISAMACIEGVIMENHGEWVTRHVPGSFYEFIQRERLQCGRLDLAFDAGNATAIFKMTTHEALEILS